MPERDTVRRWLLVDESFSAKYARAREFQADHMDDLILECAEKCSNETAQADRVRIAAYQWRAEKLKPKRYGNRTTLAGDEDSPLVPSEVTVRLVHAQK